MANTAVAAFAQIPKTASAVCVAAAVVATDTPTNTLLLFTAGVNGSIMTRLRAIPRAAATAAISLDLFVSNDGGATKRIIDSELLAIYTPFAATTAKPDTQFLNYSEQTPLRLGAGDQVYVGAETALAAGIVFVAEYTDY